MQGPGSDPARRLLKVPLALLLCRLSASLCLHLERGGTGQARQRSPGTSLVSVKKTGCMQGIQLDSPALRVQEAQDQAA